MCVLFFIFIYHSSFFWFFFCFFFLFFFFFFFFFFLFFCFFFFFFFFQAEDGIRDRDVTGVQTCALPISDPAPLDAGTAAWHRKLHHTSHDGLSEDTAQTPGMRRYEAISGVRNGSRKIWMGESHVAPNMCSADHHHGEAE